MKGYTVHQADQMAQFIRQLLTGYHVHDQAPYMMEVVDLAEAYELVKKMPEEHDLAFEIEDWI